MPGQNEYESFLGRVRREPPVDCEFQVGDTVIFTNEYGVAFPGRKIVGFSESDDFYGRFIHLDKESWWFPVRPCELTLEHRLGENEGIF